MRLRYAISQATFSPEPSLLEASTSAGNPSSFLPLLPGDRVLVYAENDGWCFGSIYGTKQEPGLFPTGAVNFVCKSEASSEGNNVVDEINRVTQDWWYTVKELYGKREDPSSLDEILDFIDELITTRKKILSDDVPAEELNLIRSQVGRTIDKGNLKLSLPVVIRQENGVPYENDSISLLSTFQEHLATEKRVADKKTDESETDIFTVLFSIHSIELKQIKYNCEVSFIIFDAQRKVFVSEPFTFIWKPGDDRSSAKDLNIKAFISSFTAEDKTKKLYLLSRIAQVSPIENTSSTLKKGQELGPITQFCRQVYAYDLLELSWIFDNPKYTNEKKDKVIFLKRTSDFDHLNKLMQSNAKILKETASCDDIKILISTQILKGTAEEVCQNHAYLYGRRQPLSVSRADFIDLPKWNTVSRNELFVTLQFGELGSKSSDRNIEARLAVVKGNGSIVEDAFESVFASGVKRSREYRSLVFYHQDKPYWMESIKILLPEGSSDDLYLRITFYSRKPYDKGKPEKGPFALAHVCLLQNAAIIKNEEHELLVYKIESSHSSYDESCTAFMPLPQTKKQLRDLGGTNNKPHSAHYSLSEKSSVHILTNVCSNVFTLNDSVLNVLRWKTNSYNLEKSLQALANPVLDIDQEMLRFMHPLLEALFELWEEREQLELPVFNVIIAFLRLLGEARNIESAEYYSKYMERFHHVKSATRMMKCLHHYIESASKNNNDIARNSLKMIGGIFQIIVAAKQAMDSFDGGQSDTEFRGHLDAVLEAIVKLMREDRERMTIQNVALKSLPQIVDPILKCGVLDPNELCSWVIKVISAFGPNIVARERLGFVGQIIETTLFEKTSCRSRLLPKCLDLLIHFMDVDNCDQKEKDFPDRATESVAIISSLLERIFPAQVTSQNPSMEYGTDDELNLIICTCYRPSIEALVTVTKMQPIDLGIRRKNFFALILALLNKMSAQIFNQYLQSCVEITDKSDFVSETMDMIRDLLSKCPFPSTWEQMILLQNKTINKALRFIMPSIQDNFADDDHYTIIWEEYMLTAVSFVTQESLHKTNGWLQDETDVSFQLRKSAAKDLRSMWFRLKHSRKMEYIPKLVGAFLKVALMEDPETRDATIPIFFNMMQCEFYNNDGTFDLFAHELVNQLDHLINENCGSQQFREHFTRILTTQCQSEKDLWQNGGRSFINNVDHLIKYLFDYRNIVESGDCVEFQMSRTVQLMNYYKKHHHTELYISYVYKLYNLHMTYNNDIEAAKTLLLHAETLTWDEIQLPDWLISRNLNSQCATERQLKEELLNQIVDLFTKGQMWEDAMMILRILEPVYEKIFVDYRQLAAIWDHMAELCRKIDAGNRSNFFYYFVGFYGKGYPTYLNGKRFVFRSDDLERLQDFKARMEQMYGNPEPIQSMEDCAHYESYPGRYMQIFPVEPVSDSCPFDGTDDKINPKIKEYYRQYNIKNFEFSRTEIRKNTKWTEVEPSDIMKSWIVKKRIMTHDALPHVLRFSVILTSSKPFEISPLRRAVDQMRQKNRELLEMATFARHYPNFSAQKLQAAILGVVQANVQGGVKNYEIFFDEKCMKIYENDEKNLASDLSAAIIEQVEILEVCLYAHARQAEINEKLHDHLLESFFNHKRYVDNNFGKTSSRLPPGTNLKRVSHTISENSVPSEKSTSRLLSTSNFMDFAANPNFGTLKSKGSTFSSTVLNILSPSRKPASPLLTPMNSSSALSRCPSESSHPFSSRADSDGTLSSRSHRLLSATSMDVIRMRRSSKDVQIPPPLPARPSPNSNNSSADGTVLDRNVLIGERHTKPPVPTPVFE